CAQSTKDPRTF
nr:immunoglobulin light chain junction region [Macaca mulatta]